MQKVEGSNLFSRLIGSPLPERASAFSGTVEEVAREALAAARCPNAAQTTTFCVRGRSARQWRAAHSATRGARLSVEDSEVT